MSQKNIKMIHRIYGCILSILLLTTGIALMISCLQIYNSGDRPFSPASIAAHFQTIAGLIYVTVAGIAGSILLELIMPNEKKRPKAVISEDIQLIRQQRKGLPTGTYNDQAVREQSKRRKYILLTAVLFDLLMVFPAIYFMNEDHFTVADLNGDVILCLVISLVPAIVGLLLCLLCRHLCSKSCLREVEICKAAVKEGASAPPSGTTIQSRSRITILRWVVGSIALIFIVVGIFNGGASDVLLKAIAICTECIGLG